MRRTTLVLLLFVVKLPMAAEEASSVTVHQAEWGDSRGEAPPPSGPAVPAKADEPEPIFQSTAFRYGEGLEYGRRDDYGMSVRYRPEMQFRGLWNASMRGQFRLDDPYEGTGERMRSNYHPDIKYGSGISSRGGIRYGFSR